MSIREIVERVESDENFIMLMMDSSKYSFRKDDEDFIIYKNNRIFSAIHVLSDSSMSVVVAVSREYNTIYRGENTDKAVRCLIGIIKEELGYVENK